MIRILVFDNYDSFTYNLVHLVEKIMHAKIDVVKNDQIDLDAITKYDKIILSPGPGIPEEAGLLIPLIREYSHRKSVLGVCLGHQAIALAFGGSLVNLDSVYHGVATTINLADVHSGIFAGLCTEESVGRYHSWIVSSKDFPPELDITATDENNYIMGLKHTSFDVQGVQFHPESILTPCGETIIRNWLRQ